MRPVIARSQSAPAVANLGPIELLILQPTPFCNLNCSYCYLPDRKDTRRMSEATLDEALRAVFASGLVAEDFTVVWHAGEPLVMPVEFYARARELTRTYGADRVRVRHSFQTNATLIDDAWCRFFALPDVAVGVSVDGPDFSTTCGGERGAENRRTLARWKAFGGCKSTASRFTS